MREICLKLCKYWLLAVVVVSGWNIAYGGEGELAQFDYPELSVVPRASDRLQSEADQEMGKRFSNLLPIQVPALTTFIAGIVALSDPVNPTSGYVGIGVGATWLILTSSLTLLYHPYTSANNVIKSLPHGSVREQLTKERAAEEEIRAAAGLGEKIKWLSILTDLGASVFMAAKVGTTQNGSATPAFVVGQGFAIGAAVVALMPIAFKLHWCSVADEQTEYKKRIYAPVASATFFPDPVTHGYIPGMAFSFRF